MPSCVAAFLLTIAPVMAQFVSAPTDLISAMGYANISVRYKQVPSGICELNPNVQSIAGYADVAPDQHVFFWFFEARNTDPSEAPLTVWLNGGPGASSLIGLFQENGPCHIDSDGNVSNNPYSWSNVSNMLYIDQPTQVGFSYSIPVPAFMDPNSGHVVQLPDNNCPDYALPSCGTYSISNVTFTSNSTDVAAPRFWAALQGFMGAFPQYSRNVFNLATESYGGRYGPVFSEYIETQNARNIPGAHNISLNTLLIGNGYYDQLIIYQSYYNFTVSPGNTYDYNPFNSSLSSQMYDSLYGPDNCVDKMTDCFARGLDDVCGAAVQFCDDEVASLYQIPRRDFYDIRELRPDPFPPTFYIQYLNSPAVQSAIGAYQNYTELSDTVYLAFGGAGDSASGKNLVQDMAKLLEQGLTVVMYHGDADFICNWFSGEAISNEVGAAGFSEAGYVNISTSDQVVHGQVKQSGSFSFVRIYEAGHEVPFYQPLASLAMFERAISGKDIATGTVDVTDSYKTVGTAKSLFREGNSTVQFSVLNNNATYNTNTNGPVAHSSVTSGSERRRVCSLFLESILSLVIYAVVLL